MTRQCVALALMAAMPLATKAARLESAYYAPDRGTPYRWFEGAKEIQSFFSKDYRAAGYLVAYVRNDSAKPVDATGFTLDGRPLPAAREAHQVIWWRLLPRPLPPGAVGEIMARLRYPLKAPCELGASFSDGSTLTAKIAPSPNPLRIETVGFNERMDRVFLVVECLDKTRRVLSQVLLDGVDVTRHSRLLAPSFFRGVSPISIRLPERLTLGGYHVYTVRAKTGEVASCCIRTTDGWVPLGSYGYATHEEFARNGCNGHSNFGRADPGDLDRHARLAMRQVSMLGGGQVQDYEVGHHGLLAHCLQDEPDCHDYGVKDLPPHLRIGYHAMEMEQRAQRVRAGNPTKPSLLTLNLTYKPANYYIYGPIADITNPDCYPISLGADATMVREVVETARLGAGPRQLTFTFQGVMEGPKDPKEFEKKRFPRPNFPAEQRIMMYYAIGAGARGLFNYIHCSENSKTRWSRGSREFPEVWNAIGQVYRELDHVAPLLALAHPTKFATSDATRLWLRMLLCGDNAALIVFVNDNYEQKRTSVRYTALHDVKIKLPSIPWLSSPKAYLVGADGFRPLHSRHDEILVPRIDVAGLILVTTSPQIPGALTKRHEARTRRLATALLGQWRAKLAAKARQRTAFRLIPAEFADSAVVGKPTNAYLAEAPGYWNPEKAKYNTFEFGENNPVGAPTQGAEWQVTIPREHAGKPHILYVCCGTWGRAGILAVKGVDGRPLAQMQVHGSFDGRLCVLRFTPPKAGEYTASFALPGPGPKGGRASRVAYVVVESQAFDPALLPRAVTPKTGYSQPAP